MAGKGGFWSKLLDVGLPIAGSAIGGMLGGPAGAAIGGKAGTVGSNLLAKRKTMEGVDQGGMGQMGGLFGGEGSSQGAGMGGGGDLDMRKILLMQALSQNNPFSFAG
jgi:hypothetical protein